MKIRKKYQGEKRLVLDWLAEETDLSKIKLKKTIGLGGLWITPSGKKKKRVKRVKSSIENGDFVELYYAEELDTKAIQGARPILEKKSYGIWFKPAGAPSDSTPFSDQGCLSAVVREKHPKAQLINRLDFEVSGLVMVGYSRKSIQDLNYLVRSGKIIKKYLAEVQGEIKEDQKVDFNLDGKTAETLVFPIDNASKVEIELITGRYHQIRRHLDMIQHPLLGDPRYGKNNKNDEGLRLQAYYLKFRCPENKNEMEVELPKDLRIFHD